MKEVNTHQLIFKFYSQNTEFDKEAILSKWFENSPYGISFKIKTNNKFNSRNKYISLSLNDIGKLDYKTQWKD